MDTGTFQFQACKSQSSVSLQEPPFELKTNCRGVFGTIGAVAGAAVGITAGVFLNMVVTPIVAIPLLLGAAAILVFSGGVVGYTAGEHADITIAERKISTVDSKNPQLHKAMNEGIKEAVHQVGQELPELARRMVDGIFNTAREVAKSGAEVYQNHLKGKTPDQVYEQYVLSMPPRR